MTNRVIFIAFEQKKAFTSFDNTNRRSEATAGANHIMRDLQKKRYKGVERHNLSKKYCTPYVCKLYTDIASRLALFVAQTSKNDMLTFWSNNFVINWISRESGFFPS